MVITFLLIFYPLIISTCVMFTRLIHPLAIGITLLAQTILICCTTGLSNMSFWFSYILFLIFLGGILVLFIYVTSLASNEIFSPSLTSLVFFLPLLFVSFILIFTDPMILIQPVINKSVIFSKETPYIVDLRLVATIYNSTNINITIFIVFYLLLTLIVVVKITDTFFGPLRLSSN